LKSRFGVVQCHWKWRGSIDHVRLSSFYWSAIVTVALSCTVCKLFNIEYYRDLEIWLRGHSRSLKPVPFKSLAAVSYSPSTVTTVVSVSVCEIFSIKEWYDLENRVRVRSMSLEMALFDRSHTSSYSPSIVTMAQSLSFARYSNLLVKNRKIFIPHLYLAPPQGWPVRISWSCLMLIKVEWFGYRTVKKYDNVLSRFHPTLLTDRQTKLLYQYRTIKINQFEWKFRTK